MKLFLSTVSKLRFRVTITILDWRCRMSDVERTMHNPSVGPFPVSPLKKRAAFRAAFGRGTLSIGAGASRRSAEIADGACFCPSSSLSHHLAVCPGRVAVTGNPWRGASS